MVANRESKIQSEILEWLAWEGVLAWRQPNQGKLVRGGKHRSKAPMPGLTDIGGILPWGQGLYVEVKIDGSYPSKEQREFIQLVRSHRAIAFVARSVEDMEMELGPILTDYFETANSSTSFRRGLSRLLAYPA